MQAFCSILQSRTRCCHCSFSWACTTWLVSVDLAADWSPFPFFLCLFFCIQSRRLKCRACLFRTWGDWRLSWKGAVTVVKVVVQGELPSACFCSHTPSQCLWCQWLSWYPCIHCYSAFQLPPQIHPRTQPQDLATWPWSCGKHVWSLLWTVLAVKPVSPLTRRHLSTLPEVVHVTSPRGELALCFGLIVIGRPADNEAGGSWAAAAWMGPIGQEAAARRAAGMHFTQEFTMQYPEFTIHYIFTIFFRRDFQYDLFHENGPKSVISSRNSWKTMNSGVPRSVLAKNS